MALLFSGKGKIERKKERLMRLKSKVIGRLLKFRLGKMNCPEHKSYLETLQLSEVAALVSEFSNVLSEKITFWPLTKDLLSSVPIRSKGNQRSLDHTFFWVIQLRLF